MTALAGSVNPLNAQSGGQGRTAEGRTAQGRNGQAGTRQGWTR